MCYYWDSLSLECLNHVYGAHKPDDKLYYCFLILEGAVAAGMRLSDYYSSRCGHHLSYLGCIVVGLHMMRVNIVVWLWFLIFIPLLRTFLDLRDYRSETSWRCLLKQTVLVSLYGYAFNTLELIYIYIFAMSLVAAHSTLSLCYVSILPALCQDAKFDKLYPTAPTVTSARACCCETPSHVHCSTHMSSLNAELGRVITMSWVCPGSMDRDICHQRHAAYIRHGGRFNQFR